MGELFPPLGPLGKFQQGFNANQNLANALGLQQSQQYNQQLLGIQNYAMQRSGLNEVYAPFSEASLAALREAKQRDFNFSFMSNTFDLFSLEYVKREWDIEFIVWKKSIKPTYCAAEFLNELESML